MWWIAVAALFSLLTPVAAESQPAQKLARIAMVYSESRSVDERIKRNIAALRAGLQDEGYVEGQHYRVDFHAPHNEADLTRLVRVLVKNNVDVINAIGAVAIREAQKATPTIPIVAHDYETDPVAAGFVATLAKPGGNITGMFLDIPEIVGKLVELLKTALPELRTITVLWDPVTGKSQVVAVAHAARTLGIEAQVREVRAGTLEQTVRSVADRKAHAIVLLGSPLIAAGYPKIAEVATTARLPTIGLFPAFARLGGLMSYGPDAPEQYRQEGRMIAKILKGAKPADLPVERPTKFYLLINLKTAKALGLTIPQLLLGRADQLIE
jgi:putative ABC transport system substrate-binding protein